MPARVPEEKVIADIERVADELGKVPSRNEYAEHGEYSGYTAENKFGTWTDAKRAAGLEGGHTPNNVPKDEIVAEIERVAEKIGESPSQAQFNEHAKYTHQLAYDRFGSWNAALEACDLETERDERIPDGTLLDDIRSVGKSVEHTPSQSEYRELGEHGLSVVKRRFEKWTEAVKQAGFEPRSVGPPTGEDNPAWAGGYGDYYGPNWHEKRRRALARDDYECAACGVTEAEHRERFNSGLEVHHIIPAREFEWDEEMNRLNNLVTLCIQCHQKYEQLPNERAKELIEWF